MKDEPVSMPSPLGIAVVDDHEVVHAGIHLWCAQARPHVRIVGNYTTAEAFLARHPQAGPPIEAVVVDLELSSRRPDFAALEHIVDAGHRAVVHSHLVDDEIIMRCLDLGATSYITKTEGRAHLIDALQAAGADTAYVGPRMAGALSSDRSPGRPSLTKREQEVLIAWFQTENKNLVAQRLSLSPSTIRTFLQRARTRYAAVGRPASSKAALVARAIQDGIISVNDL
jgi:DNA-binding NarL/FixJ family response regulator